MSSLSQDITCRVFCVRVFFVDKSRVMVCIEFAKQFRSIFENTAAPSHPDVVAVNSEDRRIRKHIEKWGFLLNERESLKSQVSQRIPGDGHVQTAPHPTADSDPAAIKVFYMLIPVFQRLGNRHKVA